MRFNLKPLLDVNGTFYDAIFNAFAVQGPFTEDLFKHKLGFNVTKINEIYQAERSAARRGRSRWFTSTILWTSPRSPRPWAACPRRSTHWTIIRSSATTGSSNSASSAPECRRACATLVPNRDGRPLLIRLHNHQTLVLGDEEPMLAFLKVNGQFRFYGDKSDPKKPFDPKKVDTTVRGGTYMTVKPELKNLIEKSYQLDDGNIHTLLSSGTDLAAAQTMSKLPQNRGLILYRPRPFWDLTCMLEERKPRLKWGGVSVLVKGIQNFQYRNELTCNDDLEATELSKELAAITIRACSTSRSDSGLQIEAPTTDGKPSSTPSRSSLTVKGPAIAFTMDLSMDAAVFGRATEVFSLWMVEHPRGVSSLGGRRSPPNWLAPRINSASRAWRSATRPAPSAGHVRQARQGPLGPRSGFAHGLDGEPAAVSRPGKAVREDRFRVVLAGPAQLSRPGARPWHSFWIQGIRNGADLSLTPILFPNMPPRTTSAWPAWAWTRPSIPWAIPSEASWATTNPPAWPRCKRAAGCRIRC